MYVKRIGQKQPRITALATKIPCHMLIFGMHFKL